jgi:glucosamine--fructose-6-phosphate aminotransferase (isomerizing)
MADSLFLREILESGQALTSTLDGLRQEVDHVAAALLRGEPRRVVALGSGASYYVAAIGAYLYNGLARPVDLTCSATSTADFAAYPSPLGPGDALVGISASGEVSELLDLFASLRGQQPLVGITNRAESTLATTSDHPLVMRAGSTGVPTSTKTFVASVGALQLLLLALLAHQGVDRAAGVRDELFAVGADVDRALEEARSRVPALAERLAACQRLFVVGVGPGHPLAMEAALVFKEVAGLPAEPVQTREMAHGPTAVVDETVGVVAIAPAASQATTRAILDECAARGATTIEIGARPDADLPVSSSVSDLLAPLPYSGPLFLLGEEVARRRGHDPDHPAWEADYLRMTRRSG